MGILDYFMNRRVIPKTQGSCQVENINDLDVRGKDVITLDPAVSPARYTNRPPIVFENGNF